MKHNEDGHYIKNRTIFLDFTRYFLKYLWNINHVLIGLLIFVFLCAYLISRAEGMSFGDSLYFTFVTAFTIGFGDIIPHTTIGKITSIIVGLSGIIFTGIIVAVSVRALATALKQEHED